MPSQKSVLFFISKQTLTKFQPIGAFRHKLVLLNRW